MDQGLLFSLKALGAFLVIVVALAISAVYSTPWLRLAAMWLRIGRVPFLTALNASLVVNFVAFFLNASITINYLLAMFATRQFNRDFSYRNPDSLYFGGLQCILFATVIGLVVSAVILARMLPGPTPESRLSLADSLALASLWYALTFTSALLIALLIGAITMCLLQMMDLMG